MAIRGNVNEVSDESKKSVTSFNQNGDSHSIRVDIKANDAEAFAQLLLVEWANIGLNRCETHWPLHIQT